MTVFIVERENIQRVPLADELREEGYLIREYSDSELAFKAIQELPVDVVITGIPMPGMSGLELLSQIRIIDSTIPVIVLTAYGSEALEIEAMERGAYDYLEIPFELAEIVKVLARIEQGLPLKQDEA